MVDETVIGFEDAVREPIVAHELPDVFHRVKLGAFRRQGDDGDVGRDDEPPRYVAAGLIGREHGASPRRDGRSDCDEMQVHRLGVAGGQDQAGALALLGQMR